MPQLNKKTWIIIGIIIMIVVIIIVVDVFLFMKYRQSKEEAKVQAKIADDIQQVQQIIQQGQISQINVNDLKLSGYADEAIAIADQAIKEEDERILTEELRMEEEATNKLENKVSSVLNQFFNYGSVNKLTEDQVIEQLYEISPNIIEDLSAITISPERYERENAYRSIGFINYLREDEREKTIPILKKGLIDSSIEINTLTATSLVSVGEKDGIAILIKGLDSKYQAAVMISEPPMPLPEYALQGLTYFTDQDFGDDFKYWQKWWEENKDKVQWDKKSHKFITP